MNHIFYDNYDDDIDDLGTPTTNNDFGLDLSLATPKTHGNDYIMNDNNNDTNNYNDIIMDNEDDQDNENIHEDDDDNRQLDPQLDISNVQLHPDTLHNLTVEANNIHCSTRVCTKP